MRFVTAKSLPERASKTRQYDLLRPKVGQKEPPRPYQDSAGRKSHQDPNVTAKSGPERATKTRQYDLIRPRVRKKEPPTLDSTTCYGQEWARKSHQDSAVRFVTAKSGPERASKTRQYDLLRPKVCKKKPQSLGATICYAEEWASKSHQDPPVRFVTARVGNSHQDSLVRFITAKSRPERAITTRQPPRIGSTLCCGQE